ncbi:uncharacterized protein LOC143018636 isoform X2 [Oratosquilla oratoria]|uniref:uncharacterized protein LOC143018636 isoform X2 n=1 Tax=Oratosquilla oratoria TaxID=337810 RepID=UPI003F7757F8
MKIFRKSLRVLQVPRRQVLQISERASSLRNEKNQLGDRNLKLLKLQIIRSAARTCLSVAVRPQTRRRHRRCRRPQPPPATSRAEWAAPATQASLQASQSVSVKCCTAGDS